MTAINEPISEADSLWNSLLRSSIDTSNKVKEKLLVILTAAKMPEKFHDKDMVSLKESGAIDILRRLVREGNDPVRDDHEFMQALGRCPRR